MKKSRIQLLFGLLLILPCILKAQDSSFVPIKKALGFEYTLVFTPALFVSNLAGMSFEYHNFLLGAGYCLAVNTNPSEQDVENYTSYSNYQGVYLNIGYLFRRKHRIRFAPYLLNQYTVGNGVVSTQSHTQWGSSASFTQTDNKRFDLYAGMKFDFRANKRMSFNVGLLFKYCSILKTKTDYTWHAPSVLSDPDSGAGSTETNETKWLDFKNFYDAISPNFGLRYYFFVK